MSWLSDKQIIEKIRRNGSEETQKAFHGIYSIDNLPEFISCLPCFLIINTHTHNLPGEHWKTVFIDENRCGELFDSLATPVSNFVIRWLNRFTRKWTTNKKRFQHPQTSTCGAFALYFILHRLDVGDMDTLTKTFSSRAYANEEKIVAFYRSLK